MIKKLLYIKNCGRFTDCKPNPSYEWNGQFSKVNVIYAENGSGKTTFTQILKSLKEKDYSLQNRKSLVSQNGIYISLMYDNKQVNYCNERWNSQLKSIEVFDNFYVEANVYVIGLGTYEMPSDFYDLVMSKSERDLINQLVSKKRRSKRLTSYRRILNLKIKTIKEHTEIDTLKTKSENAKIEKEILSKEISALDKQISITIEKCGQKYLERVNYYLIKFNPSLVLTKLNKKGNQLVYHINVDGVQLRGDSTNLSMKHTLSEGDKSSLSLSFFLARVDLLPNIQKHIVVFDDPISSFDTKRRNMTCQILSRISQKSHQFFLLTHDLNFAKDFTDRVVNAKNLKIVRSNNSSVFVGQDINLETMTGISKDLYTLQKYLKNGAISDFEKREVIRCIRPVIEGIFRLKYFSLFNDTQWLGDFLSEIKKSTHSSVIYRLNEHYDTLDEINDYCKQYHHSNPKYLENQISDDELTQFVNLTLETILYI